MKDLAHPVTRAGVVGSSGRRTDREDEINLAALADTLMRGKWWILAAMGTSVFLALIYLTLLAKPLYRATAVVMLEPNQSSVIDLQGVTAGLSGDTTEINSELEVLRARSLMARVADQLSLAEHPLFNPALMIGKAPVWPEQAAQPAELETPGGAARTRDATISALLQKVRVTNLRNSFVFHITVTTQDPVLSAQIADTIAALYIRDQVTTKFDAMEQANLWLSDRVAELQITLQEAEAEVAAFSAATDLVSIEALRGLERQLKEIRERIATTSADATTQRMRIDALSSAQTRSEQATVSADPQLATLLAQIGRDVSADAAFETRLSIIRQQDAQSLSRSEAQIAALRLSETALQDQIKRQSADLITLQQLTREAEATRVLYEHFLIRLKETSAQQGFQQADSRVLSDAVVPTAPSAPRVPRFLALALLLGVLVGTCGVLFAELRRRSFRTVQELELGTGHLVLGQLPVMPVRPHEDMLRYLTRNPASLMAEAMRNLRTSLMVSDMDFPPQVIAVTSALPGEGKTTTAVALAQSFAGLGQRVLLIEGDMRHNTFYRFFGNLPGAGLIHVLSGDRALADTVHHDMESGLFLLGGGGVTLNAADLVASAAFRSMIEEARENYDAVIIDTPPVLAVPDARIIAPAADALLFNVQANMTTQHQLEEALRQLLTAGQHISGLVLSQVNPKQITSYDYGSEMQCRLAA